MQRTAHIHIGPPKTGTSSIQQFLADNAAALLSRNVYYPASDRRGRPTNSHRRLAKEEFKVDQTVDRTGKGWSDLIAHMKRAESDILISHELFTRKFLNDRARDSILKVFADHNYRVHVIAYVRNQPDWINSWYAHQQKKFYARCSFEGFMQEIVSNGKAEPLRYLGGLLDRPDVDLEVVSFDIAARQGLELDFVKRLGLGDAADWSAPTSVNANVGATTVYVAQAAMEQANLNPTKDEKHEFARARSILAKARARFNWSSRKFVALNNEIASGIRSRFEASNREFLRRFPIGDYDDIFPARNFSQSLYRPDAASPKEAAEVSSTIADILKIAAQGRLR